MRHRRSLGVEGLLLDVKKFNRPPNLGLRDEDVKIGVGGSGSIDLKIVASKSPSRSADFGGPVQKARRHPMV